MKTTDTFKYNSRFGTSYTVKFKTSRYLDDSNLALMMVDAETEEMVCICSVNTPTKLPDRLIAIKDWSENEGMYETLKSLGIVGRVFGVIPSGFVEIKVCELAEGGRELFGLEDNSDK